MSIPKKERPRLQVSARLTVAYNLRRLRTARGWQQDRLSYEAGLHRAMIGHLENSRRNFTIDTIDALAGAFEVNLEELFLPIPGDVEAAA